MSSIALQFIAVYNTAIQIMVISFLVCKLAEGVSLCAVRNPFLRAHRNSVQRYSRIPDGV